MTKILFSSPLKDIRGADIPGDDGKPRTMADFCIDALTMNLPEPIPPTGEIKLKRFRLAEKIADAIVAIELTAEDTVMLKSVVGIAFGPLVVGRVYGAIDPACLK
ncbi:MULTISPECIES: hypothetical protein [unclassified Mesorhizobium]|uniref:hypothetical protein n=1 Tax=unclassified Mesorhizobium TaxID=325217 RepID=UPI000FCA106F|nr:MULTISPECIES: hypothetical protein [unclassified Mesorhizobium]RUU60844.1 hypothetical protein EOC99_21005 [Mesorhizobium sp. M7A.T.Ca.TU.009.01.1.1]RUU84541.1 hypothetical protein EOD03_11910 [Mesorhizobium sp. M7A.T.Ca.TU.009.01.1.2]RUT87431.1 hypothetical protein EOD15_23580 [Mesorhizobium sp. M7A.T.Ca.US.000.02.2.1]RUT88108.1 hypothetical protein EOD14_07845 [Mesorhizobium sp. M7A.T.Ca.US.000.02.1.1]RUT99455.1 hypothetical protein EOD12_21850 [Mesorhizobium sp. M7A.T.Ca.TU.009.02.1.1]